MTRFKWKTWIKENKKTCQIWAVLILIAFIATFGQSGKQKPEKAIRKNIDTYIPEGFVLVPVELSNSPSLTGLLADRGVVDLYTGDPTQRKAEKVATGVKIIRSPRDPSFFAVLAPEDQAPFLIQRFQAFHAVIQNPMYKKKSHIFPLRGRNRRSIVIELENAVDM